MNELALLVLAAAAAFGISRWLRVPVIPVLIVVGFGLARLPLDLNRDSLGATLDLGLAFLVFSAGIELNPTRYQGKVRSVLWVGGTQFVAAGFLGYVAANVLGFTGISAVFLGVALSTSSTLVVVRQLQRRMGAFGTYGRLVVGVLLLQDVAMIFFVVLLGKVPEGAGAAVSGTAAVAGMAVAAYLFQKYVAPRALKRFQLDDELLLLVVLTVLFSFAGIGILLDIPPVAGAFFAGFALSGFPVNGVVRSLIASLTTFFVAVFFTALGAMLAIPTAAVLGKALALAALVILVTPPLVTTVAEWKGGLPTRSALTSGLLLAQTSEFALILGLYGLHEATVDRDVFSIIALVAVITMTLTPFLATDRMARRLLPLHPGRLRRAVPVPEECAWKDHVLILGFGSGGMWVVKPLLAAGHEVVVVDQDPAVVDLLRGKGVVCIRGDGSEEEMLERTGARCAKVVLASMAEPGDAVNVLRHLGNDAPVIVRVFEEAHAKAIEAAGGIAILNSHASAEAFMEWFDTLDAGDGQTE